MWLSGYPCLPVLDLTCFGLGHWLQLFHSPQISSNPIRPIIFSTSTPRKIKLHCHHWISILCFDVKFTDKSQFFKRKGTHSWSQFGTNHSKTTKLVKFSSSCFYNQLIFGKYPHFLGIWINISAPIMNLNSIAFDFQIIWEVFVVFFCYKNALVPLQESRGSIVSLPWSLRQQPEIDVNY